MAVSDELVAKLQSEISMEEDMKEDDDLSANIKEYLENSPFQVRNLPPSTSSTSAHGTLD
jgi:complement component 1 Q subcomponent-binding protein